MVYDLILSEITSGIYAAALDYHGYTFTSICPEKSAKSAEQKIKARFCSWRHSMGLTTNMPVWQRGVDKINVVWKKTTSLSGIVGGGPAVNPEPHLYEVIHNVRPDGCRSFEIRKHDRPLMTETEAKMFIVESIINGK